MSDDTWWIEFMEDEVEPGLRMDMEKMLKESHEEAASLENMARLRLWTKESDPAEELWRPEKWEQMRQSSFDKIMTKIDQLADLNTQPRGSLPQEAKINSSGPLVVAKPTLAAKAAGTTKPKSVKTDKPLVALAANKGF